LFCLSGFSSWVYCFTTFISPLLSLTTRFATAGTMHLLYYSFVLFLASAFLLRSTTFSFSRSHGSAHHTSPHHTASQQYSCLHCTTFAAFLLFTRSRTLRFRSLFCSFVCSSVWRHWIQPRSFSLHSVHSQHPLILHPLRSAALCDLVDTHNPDLFCLTETLIKPTTTSAVHLDNRHSSSVDCGGAPPHGLTGRNYLYYSIAVWTFECDVDGCCSLTGRSAQVLSREQSDKVLVGADCARYADWIHIYLGDSNADLISNSLTRHYCCH